MIHYKSFHKISFYARVYQALTQPMSLRVGVGIIDIVTWYRYFHEGKNECSIQRGKAKLNRTLHLSLYAFLTSMVM